MVTNAHVVENARDVAIQARQSGLIDAEVVGTDLAMLRIEAGALDGGALPIAASNDLRVGDPVVAMGNPLGLEDSVTTGIVSALQREIRAPNDSRSATRSSQTLR